MAAALAARTDLPEDVRLAAERLIADPKAGMAALAERTAALIKGQS